MGTTASPYRLRKKAPMAECHKAVAPSVGPKGINPNHVQQNISGAMAILR